MGNPNRWSWSGAPREPHALEDAVTGNQLLKPPSVDSDSCDAAPADKKLQPGAAGVSSRRLSNNRWSWRPNVIISVTLEDQREKDQEDGEQDRNEAARPATSSGPRRLSKRNKKLDAAVPTKRPRPSSMTAPASASFGAAPSYSHLQQQQQQQQQQGEDQSSAHPSPLPIQPSAEVKDVFNRFLSRKFSKLHMKSSGPREAEPTPLPSRHQLDQTSSSRPMQAMQSPMRRGPQLHNPQNTLRGASPANPATHTQTLAQGRIDNGRIDNGRMAAPLPGLDEDTELHLLSPDVLPAAATVAATDVGNSSSPSPNPAPSADDTGILGRLMRRRLAPKDTETETNQKPLNSIDSDNANLSATVDRADTSSPDLASKPNETAGAEVQARSLLLPASHASQKKMNDKTQTKTQTQDGEVVSDSRSPPSSVPRFLRQIAKPQQASSSPTQGLGAVTHEPELRSQSESQIPSQQHMATSTPATQSKVRKKPSFGKRFWSRSGGNDVGDGDSNNHQIDKPPVAPVVRPVYVPKHAASDFSRTTYPPRHHRLGFSNQQSETSARPLATIPTEAIEDELRFREQRALALMAEKAEKRTSRELLSSAKHGIPPPQELHRRLEIVKSSQIEAVTKREPGIIDPWPQQHTLLQSNSNVSSGNGKSPARSHSQSRPRSSQRHSFNLVADPYARDLTPPKSVSPVEMEAPFDPPSQLPQVTPEMAPQQTPQPAPEKPKPYKPTHAAHSSRPKAQTDEKRQKDMTDYERFIAEAEAVEREYHAQMWRNLARRSGHYGYTDSAYGSQRPDPVSVNPCIANTHQSSRRDSAYYSVNKRASVMSAPGEDVRKLIHGQPLDQYGVDNQHGLRHQRSISRRISDYIKPSKPFQDMVQEDWMVPGRANRGSLIAGVVEES